MHLSGNNAWWFFLFVLAFKSSPPPLVGKSKVLLYPGQQIVGKSWEDARCDGGSTGYG